MSDSDEFKEVRQDQRQIESDNSKNERSKSNQFGNAVHDATHEKTNVQSKISITKSRALLLSISATLLIIAISAFAMFVWPTKWRYDKLAERGNIFPVRIDRFTGRTEIMTPAKWEEVEDSSKAGNQVQEVSASELEKIEGKLSVTNYGYLKADIYNGTSKNLATIRVRLVLTDKAGVIGLNRIYELSAASYYGSPLSSSEFNASCGCEVGEDQDFSWAIVGATQR